jgi:hypothetical protein
MLTDPIPELKRQAGAALAPLIDHWNGDDIAALLGTERERIAELRRGKLDRFSLERLIRFLVRSGARVELQITHPARSLRPRGPSRYPLGP